MAAVLSRNTAPSIDRVLQVLSCKWAPSVFACLDHGQCRPSQIERSIPQIPPRVLHRCLDTLQEFGLVKRKVFAEVPPHVEYELTFRGREFLALLAQVRACAETWE